MHGVERGIFCRSAVPRIALRSGPGNRREYALGIDRWTCPPSSSTRYMAPDLSKSTPNGLCSRASVAGAPSAAVAAAGDEHQPVGEDRRRSTPKISDRNQEPGE